MTGSRGPHSKPDHLRQRRNKKPGLVLVGDGLRPEPRDEWLTSTKKHWGEFWASEFGALIRLPQLRMVDRLFCRYDERERYYRSVLAKGRVVKGSQGQLRAHPLLPYIDKCDSVILTLEDRLGLSPRAMAAVGSGLGKAKKTLDDLNNSVAEDDAPPDEVRDPREVVGVIGRGAR